MSGHSPTLREQDYAIVAAQDVLTPALVLYPDIVHANIDAMRAMLNGDLSRWRVHVKTSKLSYVMRMLVERGVQHMKCATTLELLCACEAGATDILFAYPAVGATATRVVQIARQFPAVKISALVDSADQVAPWRDAGVGLFLDINPGMNRTGVPQACADEMQRIADTIAGAGIEFRGLHYYDGQLKDPDLAQRTRAAHHGYDRLMEVIDILRRNGTPIAEVVTAGTPTLPCSLSYAAFVNSSFTHRVSPGTLVYSDSSCATVIPADHGFRPAAVIATRVVSHPSAGRITCDAGHKSLSVDTGVPNCTVIGHENYAPAGPSEEHLPIDLPAGAPLPAIGTVLYLVPMHVCPTVNSFDRALLVRAGQIMGVEPVSARGREGPLLGKP